MLTQICSTLGCYSPTLISNLFQNLSSGLIRLAIYSPLRIKSLGRCIWKEWTCKWQFPLIFCHNNVFREQISIRIYVYFIRVDLLAQAHNTLDWINCHSVSVFKQERDCVLESDQWFMNILIYRYHQVLMYLRCIGIHQVLLYLRCIGIHQVLTYFRCIYTEIRPRELGRIDELLSEAKMTHLTAHPTYTSPPHCPPIIY